MSAGQNGLAMTNSSFCALFTACWTSASNSPSKPEKVSTKHPWTAKKQPSNLKGKANLVRNGPAKIILINALQFLYFDERAKFGLGTYSPDETLEYYFPAEHSYVLFECRTLRGQVV